jgi:hypothetical protein
MRGNSAHLKPPLNTFSLWELLAPTANYYHRTAQCVATPRTWKHRLILFRFENNLRHLQIIFIVLLFCAQLWRSTIWICAAAWPLRILYLVFFNFLPFFFSFRHRKDHNHSTMNHDQEVAPSHLSHDNDTTTKTSMAQTRATTWTTTDTTTRQHGPQRHRDPTTASTYLQTPNTGHTDTTICTHRDRLQ